MPGPGMGHGGGGPDGNKENLPPGRKAELAPVRRRLFDRRVNVGREPGEMARVLTPVLQPLPIASPTPRPPALSSVPCGSVSPFAYAAAVKALHQCRGTAVIAPMASQTQPAPSASIELPTYNELPPQSSSK